MTRNTVETRTKQRVEAIGIATILNGIACGDLRIESLVDNFVSTSKYVWKNDQKAREDAIEYAIGKLTG